MIKCDCSHDMRKGTTPYCDAWSQAIMRNLVRRYVTVQQRRAECGGVTEDDVNEIKQDVSAFRCELVEILRNSGMNTSTANAGAPGTNRP